MPWVESLRPRQSPSPLQSGEGTWRKGAASKAAAAQKAGISFPALLEMPGDAQAVEWDTGLGPHGWQGLD